MMNSPIEQNKIFGRESVAAPRFIIAEHLLQWTTGQSFT